MVTWAMRPLSFPNGLSVSNGLRRSIPLLGLLGLLTGLGAWGIARTQPPQGPPVFLWQVEADRNQVYLLGSVHLLKPEDYPLPEPMEAAFSEAETLVFEVDPASLTSVSSQFTLMSYAQPEAGESLRASLSPETYALAEQRASELGLPLLIFDPLEPWFFALTLTPLKLMSLGFEAQYGIDLYFYQKLKDTDKKVKALETLTDQLDLFDTLPASTQESFLLQTLEELDTLGSDMDTIVATWKAGDTEAMQHFLLDSFERHPDLRDRVLLQRNRNWLPAIEGFIGREDGDYLVIVGAAHLIGSEGIVDLLRDRGYTVNQVHQAAD